MIFYLPLPSFFKFDGFTVAPLIIIRKERKYDEGLLAHEMCHYLRQREMGTLRWLWKYYTNEHFRLQEEAIGYATQVVGGYMTEGVALQWLSLYVPDTHIDAAAYCFPILEAAIESRR